jgi:serine protease Do
MATIKHGHGKEVKTVNRYRKNAMIAGLLAVCLWSIALPGLAATPQEIYQKAGPAVVFILAPGSPKTNHIGTGSIIRNDGLVLTNAHIFARPDSSRLKNNIKVYLKPRRVTGNHKKDLAQRYRGQLLVYDLRLDLALIQIEQLDRSLARIEFADSERVAIGDRVYAIGHPEQGGLWSLTSGVISAYRQDHGGVPGKNLFQTDASINRGNSGGPLLDDNGKMVGINAMIARKAADGLTITDVNFSIMSNVALAWLTGLGYRFPVNRAGSSGSNTPTVDTAEADNGSTSGTRVGPRHTSQQPKTLEEVQPPVSNRKKAPNARQQTRDYTNTVPPDVSDNKLREPEFSHKSPTAEATPEKPVPDSSADGKILSHKRPYEISQLLRDMQEMEDMMDDMRGKIKRYKVNK